LRLFALLPVFGYRWGLLNYLSPFGKLWSADPLRGSDWGLMALDVGAAGLFACLARRIERPLPARHSKTGVALTAMTATTVAFPLVLLSTNLRQYSWGLFLVLPFAMGVLSVLLYGRGRPIRLRDALLLSMYPVFALGGILLATAVEGAICLLMAFPIALALALLGGALGYALSESWRMKPHSYTMMLAVVLLPASVVDFEARHPKQAPVFVVSTSMDIAASPEEVWRATIAPSRLSAPTDIAFRAGVAYPRGAWIDGTGLGATRYCDFSTGRLVEPVLAWKEPELLRFSVTANPQPMQEWTLYSQIHPPHLDGFLVSRQGQFRLIPMAGGTRIEATTWYEHNLWPAAYWRWWSDDVIHRVHRMVLAHIRDTVAR